jgi:tetratricopeptide (TPR) repeat protein
MDILAHPRLFDEEARARQIQSAVLCHNNPMVKPLVHALAKHPGWKPVFLDEVAVIFVRENVVQSLGLASALEESKNEVARRLSAEHARGSWEIPIREKLNWWQKSVDQLKPLVQLADAAAMLGDIDLSKRALDGAIALNDQFASAWSSLCRISYIKVARDAEKVGKADNKALESVESSCLRSLDLGGDRASGNQVLGLLMLNTQRPRQAVDYFQRVLWTDPLSFEGRFMLAQAYRGVGDADSLAQAKTHLFRAAELRPYEALPVLQLAAIFEKESNLQQALQLYDRAYRIGPSPEVKKKMEEIQGKLGNPSKN